MIFIINHKLHNIYAENVDKFVILLTNCFVLPYNISRSVSYLKLRGNSYERVKKIHHF